MTLMSWQPLFCSLSLRHLKPVLITILTLFILLAGRSETLAKHPQRFFFSGDGQIDIAAERSGIAYRGRYRLDTGRYDENAYRSLCRVFGAPYDAHHSGLSLRLIAFLDYLQDRLGSGALIAITSGYRSPEYNTHLRQKGALAAKASLHQYGMAADFKMEGVSPRRIWQFVRSLGFGGAGFYHGQTVHVDVGPARSWDEKSSGVGTGISDDNKLMGLVTDYDRYRPGDTLWLRFIRMTAFPIGVAAEFDLLRLEPSGAQTPVSRFSPFVQTDAQVRCAHFGDIEQMAAFQWSLPQDLSAGRYTIRAVFCDNPWPVMPSEVISPPFEVVTTGRGLRVSGIRFPPSRCRGR
jgi:uncharacterized protein YcbK (DUF882 family)